MKEGERKGVREEGVLSGFVEKGWFEGRVRS